MGRAYGGIRAAINTNLTEPQRWKGKECRLHMEFAQYGRALKISICNGNEEYCEAVKLVAQKAEYPAFSNPDVYRGF